MKAYSLPLALALFLCTASSAFADSCVTTTCHPAIGSLKNLHQPVKDGDCLSCHQSKTKEHPVKGGKSFALTAKGADLCGQCHDAMGKKKVVHAPVKEGDCLTCHNPHGAANRFLLADGEDRTRLCLGCHDGAPFKQKYVHGPVAAGDCTACHLPHESVEKALLKAPARDLCLKCHDDFATAMQAAKRVHPPVQTKPCTSCHDPHSSANQFMLKQKMPDLCLSCHVTIGKKLEGMKVIHKPLLEGKRCGNCHATHFANAKGLLVADEKGVCLGCHNTDKLGTPPLRNISQEVEGKKSLHGPIQKNRCGGCHDPHGSDFPRLLTGSYPAALYTPYQEGSYGLCLSCHDKNLLRFPDTTIYTRFRNGNRNLHFVHVADRRKGRSCRLCHETHGSSGQKLIGTEGARFGEWRVPVRFQPTLTGGSCAPGCHRPYSYDRDKPVDYRSKEEPVPEKTTDQGK